MSWNQEEEYNMISKLRSNMIINDIAKFHNRTVNEIERRIGKIIYENFNDCKKSFD